MLSVQEYKPFSEVWSELSAVQGPFRGHTFLIVVDSFSKWPGVIPMTSTIAYSTVRVSLFATHGIPEQTLSVNGPQFASSEFENFCKGNNVKHTRSAPYHPVTNGEAERFVQKFKNNMKCCSPSILLMRRRVRCRLDTLRLKPADEQQSNSESVKDYREFNIGVLIRSFTSSEEKWVEGHVVEKLGKLH
ncbi:uncharacterized protein K02A2.6-like [Penaeus indicus]|uniref:uncharacterized protein K02A2.6-like n=1 Tax=Penaeus indicus TaxID=29960 RepID=UPI00300C81DD